MKDVCALAQEVLDGYFKGKPPAWLEGIAPDEENLPEEYIIFKRIPGHYSAYANGQPIQRREYIEVGCYASSATRLNEIMQDIEFAMTAAEFRVESLPRGNGYNSETGQFCDSMEFNISRSVQRVVDSNV